MTGTDEQAAPSGDVAGSADDADFVRFERVQKSYDGETLVVKDLNLQIGKGEFLTMLGPSGSGKTTCLMMLAGFETATHGEILLDGKPINNIPPHKRGIGMVFQNYALFPHMTVAENLAFPLEVRKMDKSMREEKVKRALDDYWGKYTRELDASESLALGQTCEHAELEDGMEILELGCGWGSLTLWMAKHYPNAQITAVSNSASQREMILKRAEESGISNLSIITADMNDFDIDKRFDRAVSVEMFEHMRNWQELLRRVST